MTIARAYQRACPDDRAERPDFMIRKDQRSLGFSDRIFLSDTLHTLGGIIRVLLILFLCISLAGCGSSGFVDLVAEQAQAQPVLQGNFSDLPVADDDLLSLSQMLDAKWSFFLLEMDKYNLVRDSSTNDAMIQKMELVFAPQFNFVAHNPDGSEFGSTQGSYTPRTWLEEQDVDSWNLLQDTSTLLVPNFLHVLYVETPGQRVRLEGYHEHTFVGQDTRAAVGESRHVAQEIIVWEKIDGNWRIVEYSEINFSASELVSEPPDLPPTSGHGPPGPPAP
jgi:hypothetical protein